MKRNILLYSLLLIFGLVGCESSPKQNITIPRITSQVTFLDSSIFDDDLQSGLTRSQEEVIVNIPSKFDLNKIPVRIERWLAATRESGGNISLVSSTESSGTKGFLLDAIELVMMTYESIMEDSLYQAIEGYDGKIIYDENGKVKQIVFIKRQQT
jgi:hypothetical protein